MYTLFFTWRKFFHIYGGYRVHLQCEKSWVIPYDFREQYGSLAQFYFTNPAASRIMRLEGENGTPKSRRELQVAMSKGVCSSWWESEGQN